MVSPTERPFAARTCLGSSASLLAGLTLAACLPGGQPGPSLFPAALCAGDIEYSFVGWTTTSQLHMQFDRHGEVFAMVTADRVVLTESDDGSGWVDPPDGSGQQYQLWGRKVCISQDAGTIEYGWVVGSTSVLFRDGVRVPGEDPIHP